MLSHQVNALIGEGTTAFIEGNFAEAIRIMLEVIRIEPRALSAWNTLITCYRSMNDPDKALQLSVMAAHLQHDASQWYELANESRYETYCPWRNTRNFLSMISEHLG